MTESTPVEFAPADLQLQNDPYLVGIPSEYRDRVRGLRLQSGCGTALPAVVGGF